MRFFLVLIFFFISICCLNSCDNEKDGSKKSSGSKATVKDVEHFETASIKTALDHAVSFNGSIHDTLSLSFSELLYGYYEKNNFNPVWSANMKWDPLADSLNDFIANGLLYGLFPEDYGYSHLLNLRNLLKDSARMKDKIVWTAAELLHTDAFMKLARDLRQGRMQADSLSWHHDKGRHEKFFFPMLDLLKRSKDFSFVIDSMQPDHKGYWEVIRGLPSFLENMDKKEYTYLEFPFDRTKEEDSIQFVKALVQRLQEDSIVYPLQGMPDSVSLSIMVIQYQKKMKLTEDGKAGQQVVSSLNNSDLEKLRRVAITLDKYKQLPDSLPARHIWVNIPAFKLFVWDADTLLLESRIICGKPVTPTPELSSAVSDLVVYPTWTVPESIIQKEMLPGLKKNPAYLSKKGMYLLNKQGEKVNPDSVDWKKYSRGIPYKVQQGSGEKNALGVIKFNFANPYQVYLHDTDQRRLFGNSNRALSHGCVRVQDWQKLAGLVLQRDSISMADKDSSPNYTDSISHWISIKKRQVIKIKNRLPLFIRYFSVSAEQSKLVFHNDIYRQDQELRNLYFSKRRITTFIASS